MRSLFIIFLLVSLSVNAQKYSFNYELKYLSPVYNGNNDKIIIDTLTIQTDVNNPYFFKIQNKLGTELYDLNLMKKFGIVNDTLLDYGKIRQIPFVSDFEKINFYQTDKNQYDVFVSQGGRLSMFHKFYLEINPNDIDIMSVLFKNRDMKFPKGSISKFEAFEKFKLKQISSIKIRQVNKNYIISKPKRISFLDDLKIPDFENQKAKDWLIKYVLHADKSMIVHEPNSKISYKEYMQEMNELENGFKKLKQILSKSDLMKLKKAYDSIPVHVSTINFDK